MFGALRFFLALLVVLSHSAMVKELLTGVFAVVVFYLLSGYVMTHSFLRNFGGQYRQIPGFYLDRFLRIYPLYLFYVVLTMAFVWAVGYGRPYSTKGIVGNLLVFPLGFPMLQDWNVALVGVHRQIIPPAWSLGAELQFYLLIPFLLIWRRVAVLAMAGSFGVFLLAATGVWNTDLFGYRLIPGVLYIFLCGSVLYRIRHQTETDDERNMLKILLGAMIVTTLGLAFTRQIRLDYNLEVTSGFIVGIVLLALLSHVKPEGLAAKMDGFLGALSYPLFLCHYLVIYVMRYLESIHNIRMIEEGRLIVITAASLLLAYVGERLVDAPLQVWRKRIQTGKTMVRAP